MCVDVLLLCTIQCMCHDVAEQAGVFVIVLCVMFVCVWNTRVFLCLSSQCTYLHDVP